MQAMQGRQTVRFVVSCGDCEERLAEAVGEAADVARLSDALLARNVFLCLSPGLDGPGVYRLAVVIDTDRGDGWTETSLDYDRQVALTEDFIAMFDEPEAAFREEVEVFIHAWRHSLRDEDITAAADALEQVDTEARP